MGKRGIKSPISKAIKKRAPSRAKTLPWNRKGLSRADKVIAFCEFLPITSGIHAGRRLMLRPWQKDIIQSIYATNGNGLRPVRTALVTLPRKNGKTALAAALALCHLLGPEAEQRGQVFSAASDREQAALVYREMEAIILSVPEFAERAHIQSFHKTISDTVTGSAFAAQFENTHGLGGDDTIARRINVLANKGYIKFLRAAPELGIPVSKSSKGYLVVQDMLFGTDGEAVDPDTGEITRATIPLLPTHYQSETNSAVLPVENPEVWVLHDPEAEA